MLHGASDEQFRRFVDDTTRLVVNALDDEPATRLNNQQPSLGASRQKLIGIVWQLVVNGSTDCDIYERRARYRRGLKIWRSLLLPLPPEGPSEFRAREPPYSDDVSPQASRTATGQTDRMWSQSTALHPRFEYKRASESVI
jgi:hypothetical protein